MSEYQQYYGNIKALLTGLKTVEPLSEHFHIHKFSDTPDSWVKETSLFRSNTYSIILLHKGKAKYTIGLTDYYITDQSLYFQAPQHLRYYNRLSEWEGYVIVFDDHFIATHPTLKNLVLHFEGFKITSKVVVPLCSEKLNRINKSFQFLYEISYSKIYNKFQEAKALLELIMIQSTEMYKENFHNAEAPKHHRIVDQFEHILEQHLYDITQHKVDQLMTFKQIAEKINVNATYLGEVLKRVTGKTPKAIFSERIILEARSLLGNTDMAINEIAFFLKFQDASNFTKFFKSKTGLLPSDYRKLQ